MKTEAQKRASKKWCLKNKEKIQEYAKNWIKNNSNKEHEKERQRLKTLRIYYFKKEFKRLCYILI